MCVMEYLSGQNHPLFGGHAGRRAAAQILSWVRARVRALKCAPPRARQCPGARKNDTAKGRGFASPSSGVPLQERVTAAARPCIVQRWFGGADLAMLVRGGRARTDSLQIGAQISLQISLQTCGPLPQRPSNRAHR